MLNFPNYAKRARRAVLARDKLCYKKSPKVREAIEEKQSVHGRRWTIRTALTEFGIIDSKPRVTALKSIETLSSYDSLKSDIEANKAALMAKKPTNPAYPNGYIEAIQDLVFRNNTAAANLISVMGNRLNANLLLERIQLHQKNLHTAWEKQEEFVAAGKKSKL